MLTRLLARLLFRLTGDLSKYTFLVPEYKGQSICSSCEKCSICMAWTSGQMDRKYDPILVCPIDGFKPDYGWVQPRNRGRLMRTVDGRVY